MVISRLIRAMFLSLCRYSSTCYLVHRSSDIACNVPKPSENERSVDYEDMRMSRLLFTFCVAGATADEGQDFCFCFCFVLFIPAIRFIGMKQLV